MSTSAALEIASLFKRFGDFQTVQDVGSDRQPAPGPARRRGGGSHCSVMDRLAEMATAFRSLGDV